MTSNQTGGKDEPAAIMVQSSTVSVGKRAMTDALPPDSAGVQLLSAAIAPELCAQWLQALQRLQQPQVPGQPATARTLADLHDAGVLDARAVLKAVVFDGTAGAALSGRHGLRGDLLCHLGQSWVRHGRPPHSWHQDGALQFDFTTRARSGLDTPADALLHMRTCWIALTPCGQDAPGLQWVATPTPALLLPEELTEDAVRQRYGEASFAHGEMQAGDALLFDGTLLHRTHLRADMTGHRTSLELRFFQASAWPSRLRGREQAFAISQILRHKAAMQAAGASSN